MLDSIAQRSRPGFLGRALRGLEPYQWWLRLCKARGPRETRLLMIYDMASQPMSVGDILIYQEIALVLLEVHGLESVDFAVVYDPSRPVVPDPAFRHIDEENFLFHLTSILPASQFNPHLRSLFLFDDRERLDRFVAASSGRYVQWPTSELIAQSQYLFYHCFNEILHPFFRIHGRLPRLAARPAAAAWCDDFFAAHAGGRVPITVQLRRNTMNPERNSDYDVWLDFFSRCVNRYEATFFVICSTHEVDPRLRELPNVVIAKDFGTGLEQDLALVDGSAMHLGASSGPGTVAQFSDKPYCIFNFVLDLSSVKDFTVDGHRARFFFSTPHQSWVTEKETPSLVDAEFARIWPTAVERFQSRRGAPGESASGAQDSG